MTDIWTGGKCDRCLDGRRVWQISGWEESVADSSTGGECDGRPGGRRV